MSELDLTNIKARMNGKEPYRDGIDTIHDIRNLVAEVERQRCVIRDTASDIANDYGEMLSEVLDALNGLLSYSGEPLAHGLCSWCLCPPPFHDSDCELIIASQVSKKYSPLEYDLIIDDDESEDTK